MNPFNPCCPDQNSADFTLYEATERRVYFECPHCGLIQGLEPSEAWNYYAETIQSFRDLLAMVDDKNPKNEAVSERKAVNEVIEAEQMTVDEIQARLPSGWILVSVEQFENVVKQKNDNYEQILKLEKEIRYRTSIMVDCAALLASAGGYDHKTKNEFILRVIETLLTYREAKRVFSAKLDDNDIPF